MYVGNTFNDVSVILQAAPILSWYLTREQARQHSLSCEMSNEIKYREVMKMLNNRGLWRRSMSKPNIKEAVPINRKLLLE